MENVPTLVHLNYRLLECELVQANAAGLVVELIEILVVITLGGIFRQQFLEFFSPFSLFVSRPCNILALLLLYL
jgi:hypothetical protein